MALVDDKQRIVTQLMQPGATMAMIVLDTRAIGARSRMGSYDMLLNNARLPASGPLVPRPMV